MRIILLSIAFLFLAFSAHSQVLKSAGVWYFLDVDSMTARPAVLPNGTELAYVVGTKTVYYWNRNTSTWTAYGSTFNRDSIYFDSSIIGGGTVSDPWGVDSTLFATIAAVGDSIAAALVGYPAGSGTTNYIAKWATSTTLGPSNLFDNNTYAGVIARPWKFGEYTTAGLPTGVTGYVVLNTTTGYLQQYKSSAWGSIPTLLDANTWTGKQIIQSSTVYPFQVISSSDANNKISFNPASSGGGMFFSRLSDGNTEAGFGFYRIPGRTDGTAALSTRNYLTLANDTRTIAQVMGSGMAVEIAPTINTILNDNNASVLFDVRSTTKGSMFAPRMTGAQRTAITPLTGGAVGMGVYQTTVTEGTYINASTGWKRLLWEGDNISNLVTTITSGHVLYSTGSAVAGSANHFWDNTNSRLGLGNAAPARTLHVTGEARITDLTTDAPTRIVGADADGDLGLFGIAGGLSISGGVLTGLNGIYTGSGTMESHTTRPLVYPTGNLMFTQLYNSDADSAYVHILNFGDGARQVAFGVTDTASNGYVIANFNTNGDETMGFEIESSGADGLITIAGSEGALNMNTDNGNINMSVQEGSEVIVYGLLRATREAYHTVTSTTSPDTLSNVYSDNLINQGSTQATFTLVMPPSPQDGQICTLTYNNAISALTLDGNGETMIGTAVTTAVAGSQRKFKFYAGIGWIKIY